MWNGVIPGIVLVAMITAVAFSAHNVSGFALFSPMILAVVAGMVYSNVLGTPVHAKAGIAFSQKRLLRFAIVLLGFQLTLGQVVSIGASGVGIVALTLGATFVFTITLGRLIGVDAKLAQLIAAGTSICGASAIVATNIVTDARDEDVTYAVASITLFGTVAMLGFPLLAPVLGLDQHAFGLWAGASIHEVAQVIGAGFQNGTQSGEIATVAKLTRVAMLAPMVIALGLMARRKSRRRSVGSAPAHAVVRRRFRRRRGAEQPGHRAGRSEVGDGARHHHHADHGARRHGPAGRHFAAALARPAPAGAGLLRLPVHRLLQPDAGEIRLKFLSTVPMPARMRSMPARNCCAVVVLGQPCRHLVQERVAGGVELRPSGDDRRQERRAVRLGRQQAGVRARRSARRQPRM